MWVLRDSPSCNLDKFLFFEKKSLFGLVLSSEVVSSSRCLRESGKQVGFHERAVAEGRAFHIGSGTVGFGTEFLGSFCLSEFYNGGAGTGTSNVCAKRVCTRSVSSGKASRFEIASNRSAYRCAQPRRALRSELLRWSCV